MLFPKPSADDIYKLVRPYRADANDLQRVIGFLPVNRSEIWQVVFALVRWENELELAPAGFVPFGALFRATAQALSGEMHFRSGAPYFPEEIDRLKEATAREICRQLNDGSLVAATILIDGAGYEKLAAEFWHGPSGIQHCKSGERTADGSSVPFMIAIPNFADGSRLENSALREDPSFERRLKGGRPNKSVCAVNTYYRIFPKSHLATEDSGLTWEEIAKKVKAAGGPKVKGATLSPKVREDPRWPKS